MQPTFRTYYRQVTGTRYPETMLCPTERLYYVPHEQNTVRLPPSPPPRHRKPLDAARRRTVQAAAIPAPVKRLAVDVKMLCKDFGVILSGFQALLSRFADAGEDNDDGTSTTQLMPPPAINARRAVVIGIDYVGTANELHGCTADALAIAKFLTVNNYSEITLLLDRRTSIKSLSGLPLKGPVQIPTRNNILTSIKRLLQNSGTGDHCFIHYSGHGTSVPDVAGDEADGMDEMLVPLDMQSAGGIIDDELYSIVSQNIHDATKLTCLMDCCHSGSVMDLEWNFGDDANRFKKIASATPPPLSAVPSIIVISGCMDSETSGDTPEGGVMTQAFLHAMDKAEKLRSSFPTLQQLHTDMREWIELHSAGQHPIISCNLPRVDPDKCTFAL